MPDHCCVPGCKGNYDKNTTYVSVFQFPKDEERKKLWCKQIPRANFLPTKRTVVCERHFREDMIVRYDDLPDRNGEVVKIPRKRPMLKEDAYPCIFEGCPAYLTEKIPNSRSMENSSNEPPDADPQHSDSSVTAGPTISLDSIKTEVILPDDYDASAQSPSDDTAAVSTTSVATSVAAAPLPSLIMFNPMPKKPRIEPPSDTLQSTITAVTKDHHLRIPYNSSNLCVSSVQGTSGGGGVKTLTTNSSEDRFDVFGKNVACKLRDMDKTQRILVEKIINDALFEGEMGTLTRNHKLVDMPQSHQYKTTFLAI